MMAMLSGCDYLPGIDKIGLKTAYRLVRKHKTIEKIVRTVQFDGKMKVPKDYLDAFYRAERTFMHQWVFCPVSTYRYIQRDRHRATFANSSLCHSRKRNA